MLAKNPRRSIRFGAARAAVAVRVVMVRASLHPPSVALGFLMCGVPWPGRTLPLLADS